MIFEVRRTSMYLFNKDNPPCDGATISYRTKIERGRCYDTETRGYITTERTVEESYWTIEILDFEQLMDFCNLVDNEIIINAESKLIEIYDDYRE